MNLVRAVISDFFTVDRNIIFPSTHGLPSGSFPSGYSHQEPVCISLPPYLPYACSSHPAWFDYPNNMCWQVRIMKLLMHSSLATCYFFRLKSEYLPQHPVLGHSQPVFLPEFEIPRFTRLQNKGQNYSFLRYINYIQCGAKRTNVFQIIVTLFIFNIKKLC